MNQTRQLDGDHVDILVSIVVFKPDLLLLNRTLDSLRQAVCVARTAPGEPIVASVTLVDNSDRAGEFDASTWRPAFATDHISLNVITGHGNVGYGRGHNLSLASSGARYHLILNPDVDLAPDALGEALRFLDAHPEVALLAPRIADEHGAIQYLCRRFPSVLDLFVRGFLPERLRAPFARRLAHYEMRDVLGPDGNGVAGSAMFSAPIVSGCFMLFRTEVLQQLKGFDPRYFLYFEDYDLSLRAAQVGQVAYVPAVRIVHFGGGASRKGWRHIKLFLASAFKFFNRFGWRWA